MSSYGLLNTPHYTLYTDKDSTVVEIVADTHRTKHVTTHNDYSIRCEFAKNNQNVVYFCGPRETVSKTMTKTLKVK